MRMIADVMHHYGYYFERVWRMPYALFAFLANDIERQQTEEQRRYLQVMHTQNPQDLDSRLYYQAYPQHRRIVNDGDEWGKLNNFMAQIGAA